MSVIEVWEGGWVAQVQADWGDGQLQVHGPRGLPPRAIQHQGGLKSTLLTAGSGTCPSLFAGESHDWTKGERILAKMHAFVS